MEERLRIFFLLIPFWWELFFATVVFAFRLRPRKNFLYRLCIAVLVSMIITCLSFSFLVKGQASLLFFCWYMLIFLSFIFGLWFCFEVCFAEAVYCLTCAYAAEHMVFCLRILLGQAGMEGAMEPYRLGYLILHVLVYFLAYRFIARKMCHAGHYETGNVRSVLLMLTVLGMVLVLSLLSTFYGFQRLHSLYAFICCAFMLFSQRNQSIEKRLQREMDVREHLWAMNKAQYELSKDTIAMINRKCHDLKHQIGALRYIEDSSQRRKVIGSIEDSVMIYDSILKTGNPIFDTVLTEKSLICQREKIHLTGMMDGRLLGFMDPVDLYTVFGNALDNAIESNLRLPAGRERWIEIRVYQKLGLVVVQMENPYDKEPDTSHGLPKTVKQDKSSHGFGLQSITDTVEQYGGQVKIKAEEGCFLLQMLFLR